MFTHTAGPWQIVPGAQHPRGWLIAAHDMTYDVCIVRDASGLPENKANARLITASPDLLRELRRVYASLSGECFDWEPVRAAIARAEQP